MKAVHMQQNGKGGEAGGNNSQGSIAIQQRPAEELPIPPGMPRKRPGMPPTGMPPAGMPPMPMPAMQGRPMHMNMHMPMQMMPVISGSSGGGSSAMAAGGGTRGGELQQGWPGSSGVHRGFVPNHMPPGGMPMPPMMPIIGGEGNTNTFSPNAFFQMFAGAGDLGGQPAPLPPMPQHVPQHTGVARQGVPTFSNAPNPDPRNAASTVQRPQGGVQRPQGGIPMPMPMPVPVMVGTKKSK